MMRLIPSLILLLGGIINAQMPPVDMDVLTMSSQHGHLTRSEKTVIQLQAKFIESMFTGPLFKQSELFKDEDEEDALVDTSMQDEFINDMLAKQLALKLARDDMLGLNKTILSQMNDAR